jgi:acyl carrier protein
MFINKLDTHQLPRNFQQPLYCNLLKPQYNFKQTYSQSIPKLEKQFVNPRNSVEEVVAGIWAEALGMEQISVYDNFFALGGNPLLAIQILDRLQEVFHIELSLPSFSQATNVVKLSRFVIANEKIPGYAEKLALVQKKIHEVYKITEAMFADIKTTPYQKLRTRVLHEQY